MTCACGDPLEKTDPRHGTEHAQDLREHELRAASVEQGHNRYKTTFVVPDMHCIGCIRSIERAFNALEWVIEARANLSTRRVSIVWDAADGRAAALGDTLQSLGFNHSVFTPDQDILSTSSKRGRELLIALAVAGFAAANIMLLSISVWSGAASETAKLFHLISGLIAVPAVAIAGRPFFSSAFSALSVGRLNMDVPISLAVLLALGMSLYESFNDSKEAYFDACVMLLFFLLIGRYLDHLMREKATGSIESLAKLAAKGAMQVDEDGRLHYVAQSTIKEGMRLRIFPGERLPVDGKIVEGTSDIDRSLVTGESESVLAEPGDRLEAGVLNISGSLDVLATSSNANSYLAEIMAMMEAAQNGRGHYVRLADRMASIYAPAVHLLALVTFVVWMFQGDWKAALFTAIAVLIITCPCALGLAVPVVHVIGAQRLLKRGILMRDGSALERLSEISRVVFDKTGTLTEGRPELINLPRVTPRDARLIGALAGKSSHPYAKAIAARFANSDRVTLKSIEEHPGFGFEAEVNHKRVRLGRPGWVREIAAATALPGGPVTASFCVEGQTPMDFEMNDRLREDARPAVQAIADGGIACEILSGDREEAVAQVAEALGVDQWRSELTPKQKVSRLDALKDQGEQALMVGDGLNDAPALAKAHVSIAPATASEVGRLASDFIFTGNDLSAVPFAHQLARATTRAVRQNFAIAIVYNCIAVPLAMAGLVTPLVAAIAMSASSIAVIANSMRLNWANFSVDPHAAEGMLITQNEKSDRPSPTQRTVEAV